MRGLSATALVLSVGSALASKCSDNCVKDVGATGEICHNGVQYNNWCLANCHGVWGFQPGVPDNRCPFESTEVRDRRGLGPAGFVSSSTCSQLIEADTGFGYHHGHEDVCATDTVAGQCFRNALNHSEAEAICLSFGARLCSYHELNTNVAAIIDDPCRLDTQFSYCWTNDVSGNCEDDEAVISRCRHFDDTTRICAKKDFAGSLKCCADGPKEEEQNRVNGAICAEHKCGQQCADEPGCGWNTRLMACMPCDKPGGCTNKAELLMGECEGTGGLDRTELQARCEAYTCGAACATDIRCGWSTKKSKCVPGAKTNNNELLLGDCDGNFPGLPPVQYCKEMKCGATCRSRAGCGWSTPKMECLPGKSTSKKELVMGLCTEADLALAGIDTCSQYECGVDCANAPGCGWSGSRQECLQGLQTSDRELRMGNCQRGSTCGLLLCAQECAAEEGCGWSVNQNRCRAGAKTNKATLEENPCTDWTPAPVTAAPTRSPTTTPDVIDETASASCDNDDSWEDKNGNDCRDYEKNDWCSVSRVDMGGKQGANWQTGDNFEDFKNSDGVHAGDACCACGGGTWQNVPTPSPTQAPTTSSPTTSPPTASPTVHPTARPTTQPTKVPTTAAPTTASPTTPAPTGCFDWYVNRVWGDRDGDGCNEYSAWCEDGTYKEGAWAPGETFADYADENGVDAGDACCVCGGGSLEPVTAPPTTAQPTTATPTTQAPTTAAPTTAAPTAATYTKIDDTRVCSTTNHALAERQLWGSDRTFDQCAKRCSGSRNCNYFLYQPGNGFCRLFVDCGANGRVAPSQGGQAYKRDSFTP